MIFAAWTLVNETCGLASLEVFVEVPFSNEGDSGGGPEEGGAAALTPLATSAGSAVTPSTRVG